MPGAGASLLLMPECSSVLMCRRRSGRSRAGVPPGAGVLPESVQVSLSMLAFRLCRCPSPRVLVSCCAAPPSPSLPPASSVTTLCLQGHSSPVTCLDFSSNGKYLASCSEDRTVRLWSTRDLAGREHRCLRANVGLDHAEFVRLSPDSRYGRTLYRHWDVLQSRQSQGRAVVGSVVLLWNGCRQHLSLGHHSITESWPFLRAAGI